MARGLFALPGFDPASVSLLYLLAAPIAEPPLRIGQLEYATSWSWGPDKTFIILPLFFTALREMGAWVPYFYVICVWVNVLKESFSMVFELS